MKRRRAVCEALQGRLRDYQAFFDVALPGLVVPDAPLCLLSRQLHLARDVVYADRPVLLLIVGVPGRAYVEIVSALPFVLGLGGGLYPTQLRHKSSFLYKRN